LYSKKYGRGDKIRRVDLKISPKLLEEFEKIRREQGYTTRSEAIRIAMREFVKRRENQNAGKG